MADLDRILSDFENRINVLKEKEKNIRIERNILQLINYMGLVYKTDGKELCPKGVNKLTRDGVIEFLKLFKENEYLRFKNYGNGTSYVYLFNFGNNKVLKLEIIVDAFIDEKYFGEKKNGLCQTLNDITKEYIDINEVDYRADFSKLYVGDFQIKLMPDARNKLYAEIKSSDTGLVVENNMVNDYYYHLNNKKIGDFLNEISISGLYNRYRNSYLSNENDNSENIYEEYGRQYIKRIKKED